MNEILTRGMQDFYSSQSCMTDPGQHRSLFDSLPSEISELVNIVQGLILHIHWSDKYGVFPSDKRKQEANLRFISKQLEQIKILDPTALHVSRPVENRLLGTCRDFSVFLCALLRHQGIPARARCGFGTYFTAGHYEDHWVCEYWEAEEERWIMVDAQLDSFQCEILGIDFDPLNIPAGRFIPGGKAWQMCRSGHADPGKFGVFNMHGLWFVRGNLVRDAASLNKMELLPWDCWGLITGDDDDLPDDDLSLLDRAALVTSADNGSFSSLRALYKANKGLIVPTVISSFTAGKFQEIDLKEDCDPNFQTSSFSRLISR